VCAHAYNIHLRGIHITSLFPAMGLLCTTLPAHEWLIQARGRHLFHFHDIGGMPVHLFCDIHLQGIFIMSSFPSPESLWMTLPTHQWLIQARDIHHYHLHDAGAMRAHVFVIFICEVFAKWAHFQHQNHFEWYHPRMSDLLKRGLYTILTCMMQVEYVCTCLRCPSARYL